jgi:hypothetical protein
MPCDEHLKKSKKGHIKALTLSQTPLPWDNQVKRLGVSKGPIFN